MAPVVEDRFSAVHVLEPETAPKVHLGIIESLWKSHHWLEWVAPLVLCSIMFAQLFFSTRQLSQTFDEPVHLYSGYRYLKCGDLTVSPEHPPLAKIVAASPLLSMNPQVDCTPFRGDSSDQLETAFDQYRTALMWFYSTDWRTELSRARLAISLFSIALFIVVYVAARRMFDPGTAIVAALLLIFEPNLLAHGMLVTTDMAVTAMLFFAFFGFYLWTRKRCAALVALAGIGAGLTLLAKTSGISIIPSLIALAIADALLERDRQQQWTRFLARNLAVVLMVLFIAYGVVWAGYGMRYSARAKSLNTQETPSASPADRALLAVEANHLLPQAYLEGFSFLFNVVYGQPATGHGAPWYVLPRNLLIRCTVGFLAIALLSLPGIALGFRKHRREIVFLLVPIVLFAAGFMRASWNGGMRHMLPLLPFLIVLISAGCLELAKRLHSARYAIPCLLVLHATSSLHAAPNYLSYANELWGGPTHSYRYLGGEPDWGQSYLQAAAYMAKHPSDKCWLMSDLLTAAPAYGLKCKVIGYLYPGLVPAQMNGTVLIGDFTYYSGRLEQYEEVEPFKNIAPTDTIGGSAILVFKGNFDTRVTASMSATIMAREALRHSDLREALQLSNYAIQLSPRSVYGHCVHANILAQLGDPNAAISELEYARNLALSQPSTAPSSLAEIDKGLSILRR